MIIVHLSKQENLHNYNIFDMYIFKFRRYLINIPASSQYKKINPEVIIIGLKKCIEQNELVIRQRFDFFHIETKTRCTKGIVVENIFFYSAD